MNSAASRPKRSAFTLIELLVVMAIIAILVGLLVPAVQQAREAASRTECANHLKQIGLAAHLYPDAFKNLPPSRVAMAEGPSWPWLLLPYLDQLNLYDLWPADQPYPGIPAGTPLNAITQGQMEQAIATMSAPLPVYYCPSRRAPSVVTAPVLLRPAGAASVRRISFGSILAHAPTGAAGDYAACTGTTGLDADLVLLDGMTIPQNGASRAVTGVSFAQIIDGTSNTFWIGEKHVPSALMYKAPLDSNLYDGHFPLSSQRAAGPDFPLTGDDGDISWKFGSRHPGICQFAFCDGTVRPLSISIDPYVLGLLAQRNDEQPIPDF